VTAWAAFHAELDAWAAAGRTATFWWRDDDATAPTPALNAMLGRAERFRVPLCLAVIPAAAEPALAARLAEAPEVSVLQHGYAHRNWAAPPAKKAELAENRGLDAMMDELARGLTRLAGIFAGFRPVLVPPWNRIAAKLVPHLPELGFRGLSTYGLARPEGLPPDLRQANTHADLIDWRGGRGFVGEDAALTLLMRHLLARRQDAVADLPTGLLTHHAVKEDAGWNFAEKLFQATATHPAARWLDGAQVFAA